MGRSGGVRLERRRRQPGKRRRALGGAAAAAAPARPPAASIWLWTVQGGRTAGAVAFWGGVHVDEDGAAGAGSFAPTGGWGAVA